MTTAPLSLEHIIKPSTLSANIPVLFMLHGYGSNEEDLFSFASELPEELCIISVRAPYDLPPSGYAWYAIHYDSPDGKWSDDKQAILSRDRVVTFIDEACLAYGLDADNVTLLGFSQGTILSYAVALSYPEKVKNVVGLSGYMNTGIFLSKKENTAYDHLNIYNSHGTVDQVIPLDWAEKTPKILADYGIKSILETYPVGHGVAPQNFYSFRDWLKEKI